VYLDLSGVLDRASRRPVVAAGLPAVIALPVAASGGQAGAWEVLSGYVAACLGFVFLLLLVFGRRKDASLAAGQTLFGVLLVGLGAAALLLLAALPAGLAWVAGLAVLVAAVEAGPALGHALARRFERRGKHAPPRAAESGGAIGVLGATLLLALVALVLAFLAAPPFTWVVVALVALTVLVAGTVSDEFGRAVSEEASGPDGWLGRGHLFRAADGLLVAAPATYVLARSLVPLL
jgi:hypothetical protein